MSWVSLSDEIAAVKFLLGRTGLSGPVNVTAPAPVTNAEFTAALNVAAGRRPRPWLRVPAPLLRLAVGEASVELLSSARILPGRLQEAGYEFRYPDLPGALRAELEAG
jgi:NAD dependent epimerase/dehydratase family enzyme